MHSVSELPVAESGDPAPDSVALLRAEHVSFSWRGRSVLRDVVLRLYPGELIGLRGSNGAGKTTLLRLLAGALEPDAGAVHRRPDGRAGVRCAVGLVGAGDRGLYARLDVEANLELAVALALVPRRERRRQVAAALTRFALGPIAGHRVDRLSTGQRQRVRLALGFVADPEIALLDEPAGGLDADATALLAAALEELVARDGAGIWTAPGTPDRPPALPCTRDLTLVDGGLRAG